jgi:TonB family protein
MSGWVQLEFEINDVGATENVRVVESSNEVFDAAAIAAVQRWRYVPRFENGLPVAHGPTQTVISFCLEPCSYGRNPPPKLALAESSPTP